MDIILNFLNDMSAQEVKMANALFGPIWGLILMRLAYSVFDRITFFKTAEELKNGNIAVAIVVGSIFIGIGICVGLTTGFAIF